jgi:hypothetical protein
MRGRNGAADPQAARTVPVEDEAEDDSAPGGAASHTDNGGPATATSTATATRTASATHRFCHQCGTPLRVGARFCGQCGAQTGTGDGA